MSKALEELNKEQLEAVTHASGPLIIIAGAGTGKTTVMTRRIGWAIEEEGVQRLKWKSVSTGYCHTDTWIFGYTLFMHSAREFCVHQERRSV